MSRAWRTQDSSLPYPASPLNSDGIANHILGLGNHDWFQNPYEGLGVVTALIVWGAIPFVAITVYAGLAQVPGDLVEAAAVDGAGAWRVFRDVTFPILKELIQNAEDSSARAVDFAWSAGIGDAAHPLLRGPALIAVNDGPFTATDHL